MRCTHRKEIITLLASGLLALQALAVVHVFLHAPLAHAQSHCTICAHGLGLDVLTVSATMVPAIAAPANPPPAIQQYSTAAAPLPLRQSRSPPAEI